MNLLLVLLLAHLLTATLAVLEEVGVNAWRDTGVDISIYANPVFSGSAVIVNRSKSLNVRIPVDSLSNQPFSVEAHGSVFVAGLQRLKFACDFAKAIAALFWVDGHLVCETGIRSTRGIISGVDNPLNVLSKKTLPFRLHLVEPKGLDVLEFAIQVFGAPVNDNSRDFWKSVATFSPYLADVEITREVLQRTLSTGWGTWLHRDVLTIAKLPENYAIGLSLCGVKTHECIRSSRISRQSAPFIRVEEHAYDRSFASYHLAHKEGCNVTVQFAGGEHLTLSVTATSSHDPVDFYLAVTASCLWTSKSLCTTTTESEVALSISQPGLLTTRILSGQPLNRTLSSAPGIMAFNVPVKHSVILSTRAIVPSDVNAILQKNQDTERKRYQIYGHLSETKRGIQAGLMWNLIHTPAELGPIFPGSHNWNFASSSDADYSYVIFEWDNIFASYMLSLDAKELAYSNFIQVIKSKTANGFVPNFSGSTAKSLDRTEPPIGARVLLEMYKRYKDKWLVQLLFNDILDWNEWFYRERVDQKVGLVSLGGISMQNARYESGLDNSPMYDGDLYNPITGLMDLYDVGFSSLVAAESKALAVLAKTLGETDVAKTLVHRGEQLSERIKDILWENNLGIYVNKLKNGSFVRRVSPTSFYPMIAGIPSPEQAETMAKSWLLNNTRFCISADGDFEGNTNECYWGLPSIQASDPAFPKLGYWRGYVWGPMAQLVYWGLDHPKYRHCTFVQRAKASLAKQMNSLFMHLWSSKRHVCENFSPHKDSKECTGDKFYHWGGLTGFLSLLENGYYEKPP